jgi:hypothetical protein
LAVTGASARKFWDDPLAFDRESGSTAAIMQTARSRNMRWIVVGVLAVAWPALMLQAEDATYPSAKASPPKIETQVVLLAESVVQTQWTHTLNLVNAPQNITLLNPGQCIRVGIYSTGDKRDDYLQKTKLSFRVQFAGHSDAHPFASPSAFKQIKPEGGDFVTAALGAAGVKQPAMTKTMASLGVSGDHWCAPIDAGDGTATVETEVEAPGGHQTLSASTLHVESFDTGSKKSFQDGKELGTFLQTTIGNRVLRGCFLRCSSLSQTRPSTHAQGRWRSLPLS